MPGDIEGRSLRLGPPDIVTIPEQIQPDIVLGLPPMHADWINPNNSDLTKLEPGCDYIFYQVPCLVNLTTSSQADLWPGRIHDAVSVQLGFYILREADRYHKLGRGRQRNIGI